MDLNKPNQDGNQSAYSGYEQVSGYQVPPQRERKTGLAIAALILGIISLIGLCCCGLNIITAPLAIIFGIVSIVKKRDGTGLSITGIVLAALSLVMMFSVIFSVRDILPYSDVIMSDYMQLLSDQDTVFPAYKEDQTLPEYLEKANALIKNPDALTKTEAEDGDIVYYLPSTGEICFTTPGGTIRTYYIADYDYFNRQ